MRKLWVVIIGLAFTFLISKDAFSCPECGCWEQWVRLQKRPYLDKVGRLPTKEKIATAGEYEVFLTLVQIEPQVFELLVYAQHLKTKKPYIKPKNIALYKQTSQGLGIYSTIKDENIVSQTRYVNTTPADYLVRVELEPETSPLIAETYFTLGLPPPDFTYLTIIGVLFICLIITVFYLGRLKPRIANQEL